MSNIPEAFYAEIAVCDPQWQEWKELYHIDVEKKDLFTVSLENKEDRSEFLKTHPTLVLDTRYFGRAFNDRLLSNFDNLDEITDGLLLHTENFQAINFLREKYDQRIQTAYIDPPYNATATQIVYKNEYKHSTWLALIQDRVSLARSLLTESAINCITIDDYELHRLRFALERIYTNQNYLGIIVIRNNPSGRSTVKGFSINHEYALFYCQSPEHVVIGRLPHTEKQKSRYNQVSQEGKQFEWENFRKNSAGSYRPDRPKQFFPMYYDPSSKLLHIPEMRWQEPVRSWEILEKPNNDEITIWPLDDAQSERVWRFGVINTRKSIGELIVKDVKGKFEIYKPKFLSGEGSLPRTWWDKPDYSARDNGTRALVELFGSEKGFDFPKAPEAVKDCLRVCATNEGDLVLDYFAGSGTTGQAVIELNRLDDGGRKFILVEMEQYFDDVLLPRIKKITYTPHWKNGKPERLPNNEEVSFGPRIVKYIRLESYEDALNNITFDEAPKTLYDLNDYLLKYMLDWEAKQSVTFLNVSKLASPFSYKLNIIVNQQKQEKVVDIPETFSYLFGLNVKTRRVFSDDGRRYLVYCGSIDHREIAVIWRDIAGWQDRDFQRDKKFVAANKIAERADEILVNGDSLIPNAQSLDAIFKSQMFGDL
jgi:adenine-specific DNA-methyltransferase